MTYYVKHKIFRMDCERDKNKQSTAADDPDLDIQTEKKGIKGEQSILHQTHKFQQGA